MQTRIICKHFLQITVYLGKRDFVDHISHVDPIGKLIAPYKLKHAIVIILF